MISTVELPAPLAVAVLAAFAYICWRLQRWAVPNPWTSRRPARPARHRLANADAEAYRPRRWAEVAAATMLAELPPVRHTWNPDELEEALDAAQRVREQMLAAERSWEGEETHELVVA